ncbi:MAG TPA: sialidase family protein [Solirubrobacterales bacterium]
MTPALLLALLCGLALAATGASGAWSSGSGSMDPRARLAGSGSGGARDEDGERAEQRAQKEERLAALERARRRGTLGLTEPLAVKPARGWRGERLWHPRADDWEPAVAGRPGSARVYMLTTRFGRPACERSCPDPAIRLRASRDGGRSWGRDRYLCRCRGSRNQYDPQIEVASDGSLYAAWLDGFTPGVTFARSDDHGHTWTKPVHVDRRLAWSDKPILAISGDGKDVYIAFNGPTNGDAYVAVSHDRGDDFGRPVPTQTNRRYHFAGGGVVAPDGTVAFAGTSYNQHSTAGVRVLATTSTDGGQSWRNVKVDRMAKQPNCISKGCPKDFYGPQAAIAGDANGELLILYNGAGQRDGDQRVYARRSRDGGLSWSARTRVSPADANAAFPAAIGGGAGDFRVWYMDDRRGSGDRWNVWFRRSTDGGGSWSKALRISDASGGTAYVRPRGFLEPYGDYGELAIIDHDQTFAVWGEGISYTGPGGTWYNRTR